MLKLLEVKKKRVFLIVVFVVHSMLRLQLAIGFRFGGHFGRGQFDSSHGARFSLHHRHTQDSSIRHDKPLLVLFGHGRQTHLRAQQSNNQQCSFENTTRRQQKTRLDQRRPLRHRQILLHQVERFVQQFKFKSRHKRLRKRMRQQNSHRHARLSDQSVHVRSFQHKRQPLQQQHRHF